MRILNLANPQLLSQTIGHELNLLSHEGCVHSNKTAGKCLADELLFKNHCLANQITKNLRIRLLGLLMVESHREERVKSFIPRDELIAERESRKKTPLLEPEDGTECTAEEDTFDRCKGCQTGGKVGIRLNPLQGPLGLLSNAWNRLDGVKEVILFGLILDLGINQQGLRFRMDAFHRVLESLEETSHWTLNFPLKADGQILLNNPVTACEEGKNGLNEMPLIGGKFLEVVAGEVNLLGGPERSQLLLLHRVEVLLVVGNGEEGVTHDGISSIENLRFVLQEMSGSNRTDQLLQHVMVPKIGTYTSNGRTQYRTLVNLSNIDTITASNLVVDTAQFTNTEVGTADGNLILGLGANPSSNSNTIQGGTTAVGVETLVGASNVSDNLFMGYRVASNAYNVGKTVALGPYAGRSISNM